MNMTKKEALAFLALNQPMPNDYDITQELINKYNNVRLYFSANPAEEAIPLFLQSFGEGDGFGVYQLVEDFLYKCDKHYSFKYRQHTGKSSDNKKCPMLVYIIGNGFSR